NHMPYAGTLPQVRQPAVEEIELALTRQGKPQWNDEDFQRLLFTVGCAGYGWLRPEGVRRELENFATTWQGPPPLEATGGSPASVAPGSETPPGALRKLWKYLVR